MTERCLSCLGGGPRLDKALATCAWLLAASFTRAASVTDVSTDLEEMSGANWSSYGRTHSETRFSPLTLINDHNVTSLGLAWHLDLPAQTTLEGTPLAVDGILYFSGTYGRTFAVDARSGRALWEFDPELAAHNPQKLRLNMGAHRGLAYWSGMVFVGTNDGRLLALDARSGRVIWSVQTADLTASNPKFISGAPRIFNGKVIIGHGTAEAGTRGYVTTYDAKSGRELWRFYTVPSGPSSRAGNAAEKMAARTWDGDPGNWGGGAVWDSVVYDPDFNRVYLATGNGNPVNAAVRSPGHGDNLFLSSIVALDAETGSYVWHYQINPRDSWDYDATQQIVLADLPISGHSRKVLMQAPKNGFFYVIDRATGRLISAQKYAKATWASRIDIDSGRPVEATGIHYERGAVTIWPSSVGAHNWQPMSFDPNTHLVYIPTMKLGMRLGPKVRASTVESNFVPLETTQRPLYAVQFGAEDIPYTPDRNDGTGALLAWDPVRQRKRWKVHYDTIWNGGTLCSAGNLVFQGTGRGQLIAYRAATGERLWSYDTGLGIIAAPITYLAGRTQYVAILVGYGGLASIGMKMFDYGWRFEEQPRRLLTFALNQRAELPPRRPPRITVNAIDDASVTIDAEKAAQGAKIYDESFCWMCHGQNLENTGSIAPDLRESRLSLSWPAFRAIVRKGTLADRGMPKFDDLAEEETLALYMYVRQRARDAITF